MTPEHLAGIELEIGAVERRDAPELLDESDRLEGRRPVLVRRHVAHRPTFRIQVSSATATMIRAPIAKFW